MGVEVVLPSVKKMKRRVYMINWSGDQGPHRWRWKCPAGCGFEVDEDQERDAQQAANAHECNGGWCAIPVTNHKQEGVDERLFG